jgi:sterol desaturase/sphingolipid hydroxylase (fatty acid hydroxylase superfamily)
MIDAWVIKNANTLQFILFFGLFAVFALAEVLEPKRLEPAQRKVRWFANLVLTFLNVAILSFVPVTLFTASVWVQKQDFGLLNLFTLPMVVVIIVTLLSRGFISFFTHYLSHKVPLFWRLHRVHHLDTQMDVSTTVRFHPLEFLVNLLIGIPIVSLLGLTPWVLLLYEILDAAITLFSHANIRLPKGLERTLRYVIVTPDLHRVHHSSYQPETDSNFGAVFPIWDIIFGTFRTETRVPQEVMEIGVEEVRDGRTNQVVWLLTSPLVNLKRLAQSKASKRNSSAVGQLANEKNH